MSAANINPLPSNYWKGEGQGVRVGGPDPLNVTEFAWAVLRDRFCFRELLSAQRCAVTNPHLKPLWGDRDDNRGRQIITLTATILIAVGIVLGGQGFYIRAKAALAQVLLERAWAQTIETGHPVKAWSWADTHPVARISFPRLGRAAIVLEEAGGEALAFGPAHVAASPEPGDNGTSVIGGHRDTHFAFIKDLRPGDEIDVATPVGKTIRYRMTGAAVVHADASGIATNGNVPRLALVTCYPFDGLTRSSMRYVVFADAKAAIGLRHPDPPPSPDKATLAR